MRSNHELAQELASGTPLDAVLAVDVRATEALRARAMELFEGGELERCRRVLIGLAALGSIHPADAMLLSRVLAELGENDEAIFVRTQAHRLLEAAGLVIPPEGG